MENNQPTQPQELPPEDSYEQEFGEAEFSLEVTSQRKILSYLGELRVGDRVPVMRMIADLRMIYSTAAMQITQLIDIGYVTALNVGGVQYLQLSTDLPPATVLQITGAWKDAYGTHPYSGATATQRRRGRYTKLA